MSGLLATDQVARSLGISRQAVQKLIKRGTLSALVVGKGVRKTFLIHPKDLADLKRQRRKHAQACAANLPAE